MNYQLVIFIFLPGCDKRWQRCRKIVDKVSKNLKKRTFQLANVDDANFKYLAFIQVCHCLVIIIVGTVTDTNCQI